MRENRLFFVVAILILLTVAGIVVSHSEAKVLPAGTVITFADGTTQTLTATGFLLSREDMNAATVALEEKPVDAKEILDLHSLSDKQQKSIDNSHTWEIIIGVASFALGVVADELIHK